MEWHTLILALGLFLALFGCVGMALSMGGMTAVLSLFYNNNKKRSGELISDLPLPNALTICLCAHNEEAVIATTIDSIGKSALRLRQKELSSKELSLKDRLPSIRILVGLDHCTDHTQERAEKAAHQWGLSIEFTKNPGHAGKWYMISHLVSSVDSVSAVKTNATNTTDTYDARNDWIALVDCGAIWSEDLLVHWWAALSSPKKSAHEVDSDNEKILAVAPSYGFGKGAFRLEQRLKAVENKIGGPVSVHGATVFYSGSSLQTAVEFLNESKIDNDHNGRARNWFNDDVVIPLVLRLTNPHGRILYILRDQSNESGKGLVGDLGVRDQFAVEMRRRRRMIVGNLQWILSLWIPMLVRIIFQSNSQQGPGIKRHQYTVLLLALRRVTRVFWAYWVLFILFGLVLAAVGAGVGEGIPQTSGLPIYLAAMIAFSILLARKLKAVTAAFLMGLKAPFWLVNMSRHYNEAERGVSWG